MFNKNSHKIISIWPAIRKTGPVHFLTYVSASLCVCMCLYFGMRAAFFKIQIMRLRRHFDIQNRMSFQFWFEPKYFYLWCHIMRNAYGIHSFKFFLAIFWTFFSGELKKEIHKKDKHFDFNWTKRILLFFIQKKKRKKLWKFYTKRWTSWFIQKNIVNRVSISWILQWRRLFSENIERMNWICVFGRAGPWQFPIQNNRIDNYYLTENR